MSAMDMNKDLAYQQTLRNQKPLPGSQAWAETRERDGGEEDRAPAGAGAKGSLREHSAMVRTLQQAQGQQGHSDVRREDHSEERHQIMKACYAGIRKWISN